MRTFGRLLRYAMPYKARLCLVLGLSILSILAELARPWPVKLVVDYVLGGRPMPPWLETVSGRLPGAETPSGLIAWSVAAAVISVVAGAALSVAVLSVGVGLGQRLVYDLSLELFAKLQRLSQSYHGRQPVGDLLQRISGDSFVVYFAVAQVVLPGAVSLLTLAGMFTIMASIDGVLTLITLSMVPLLATALALFNKPMERTTTRQYEAQGAMMAFVEQGLSAIRAVQAFAREAYMHRRFEGKAGDLASAYGAATRVSSVYQQVTAVITGLVAALLLGFGATRVQDGRLSLGELLVFLGYLGALYGPVIGFTSAVGYAVQVVARSDRVFAILDSEELVPERADAIDLGCAIGEVVFEDVTFGYHQDEPVSSERPILRNVSFRAHPGQITAIVGATGAGKTTLMSLLSRFYDPDGGRVLVDGHDVRDLSLRSLRENVSIVLQEAFLFPMSIADNIAFGRPEATRAEIVAAATAARAHTFISRLPEGYDTVIGERGASLSGGERQRISIARAVLKDAPILVLDEPTSSVDARTESQIFTALSDLMHGRTTFVISHRLTTIRRADQILALENGHIVERGTHDSLLASGTVYAGLYRHQHIAVV